MFSASNSFCFKEGLLNPCFTISTRARGLPFSTPLFAPLASCRQSLFDCPPTRTSCALLGQSGTCEALCLLRINSHSVTNCDITTQEIFALPCSCHNSAVSDSKATFCSFGRNFSENDYSRWNRNASTRAICSSCVPVSSLVSGEINDSRKQRPFSFPLVSSPLHPLPDPALTTNATKRIFATNHVVA